MSKMLPLCNTYAMFIGAFCGSALLAEREDNPIPCYTCREYYRFVPYCLIMRVRVGIPYPIEITKGLCRDLYNPYLGCPYYKGFESKIDLMIAIIKSEHPEIA